MKSTQIYTLPVITLVSGLSSNSTRYLYTEKEKPPKLKINREQNKDLMRQNKFGKQLVET